ncbi:collagen alpha-1(III) chain [Drosophila miranda]|uniref:collagen alpha-1(III) chain n=1 Tax=Drosophila miranda TaxID=7229 RepID=UPI00143F44CE|nr:collagen alpha-1(III) chain [Drosophila miranda]
MSTAGERWKRLAQERRSRGGQGFGDEDSWTPPRPYEVMRQQNCKTASFRPGETYPSIRTPVSRCSREQTINWLADSIEADGCGRPYGMSNDDILQMWQQSPHKNTLGYYGVGSQVPKPEAVKFNQQITQSLQRANGLKQRRKQLQLQGPRTLPTIGGKKIAASAYKPYVLNREAIKAAIQKMPTVKKNLSPSQALTTVYCHKSDPVDPFGVTKEKQQQQPELKMEHAPLKKTYGHRRPYRYCGWRCDEPKNKCTDYEWKKYKQDPRPCDEDLKREQKVAQEQTQVPEPRNYEELYLRLVKCFEALKVECPMCKVYAQCCNPRGLEGDAPGVPDMDLGYGDGGGTHPGDKFRPGDKPGRGSKPGYDEKHLGDGEKPEDGGKPGYGDRPGGKPGVGDQSGGKPGDVDKPGGRPGDVDRPGGMPGYGDRPGGKPGYGDRPGGMPGDGDKLGGKPGDGDKYGGKPGDGDKTGGKPGYGDKPGGKPGGGDKPGGKPGDGDKPAGKPGGGDKPGGKPGDGDKPGGKPGDGDKPGGMPGDGDKSGGKPGDGDKLGGKPGGGDKPGGKPGDGDKSGGKPGGGDKPGGKPGVGDKPGGKPGDGDKPGGKPGGGDKPGGKPGGGDKPGGKPGGGDKPGGKPGVGDKPGGKPGDGDKPGGKPGGGDKPGGKPGGLDKPGGKPGGGGKPWDRPAVGEEAPDYKGQAGDKPGSLHEDEKKEGGKGKLNHKPSESKLKTTQPDDPDAPDKPGGKDKGKSKRPRPSKPECDPDDPFCDTYSQDTPKQSINKPKGSKTSRPSERECDPNDPLCSVKKDPGDSLTQPPGAPPIGPISQPTQGPEIPKKGIKDQGPPGGDGKTGKGKGPKGGPSREEVKPEKENIPSCPCPICEFLRRHNEPDSPMIREMKRQDKLRQQREYYKQMCHRQYLECREPEYRAPQHRCDPIDCDNTFCSNPKLGDYCECLKAMQDLQQMLGKNHKIVGNQLLFDLEDLRSRLCKQMCDCL